VILKSFLPAGALVLVVFAIGSLPPLLYASRFDLLSAFHPGPLISELLAYAVLFTGLYFYSAPSNPKLCHGGIFGAGVGLLVLIPELASFTSTVRGMSESVGSIGFLFWAPYVLGIAFWYISVWAAAGATAAWAIRRFDQREPSA
jgi:hypothetical protein